MRCMSNCPTDAVQGGQGWLLFYVWLVSLPVGAMAATALLSALGLWAAAGSIVGLALSYLWIMVAVWSAYSLLWFGLLVPGLGAVLAKATLTPRYRRYRGPGNLR
jgi:ABC-type microcin C transport system permease subunit YejB